MYSTKIVCNTNKKQKKKKRGEYNGLLTTLFVEKI